MAGLKGALAVSGISAGLQDVQNRQEHQQDRQYLDQARQQKLQEGELGLKKDQLGLQEAQHQMQRQGVMENRQDEEYQRKKQYTDYIQKWENGMRNFFASGGEDFSGVTNAFNDYPGAKATGRHVAVSKNDDGTFNVVTMQDGKVLGHKKLTQDQIGEQMMVLRDPTTFMKSLEAQKAKAADRQFELQKMEKEYGLKGWLEAVKNRTDPSKMSKLDKDMWQRAKDSYGTMNNGVLTLDDNSRQEAAYTAFLSTKMYKSMSNPDENAAHLRAMQVVDQLRKVAKDAAAKQTDDPDRQQALEGTIMNQLVTQAAGQLGGLKEPGAGGGKKGAQPQGGQPGLNIPQGAIDKLKTNPGLSDAFDEKYGKGAAAKVLKQKQQTQDSGSVPGISDAGAAEKKPGEKKTGLQEPKSKTNNGKTKPKKSLEQQVKEAQSKEPDWWNNHDLPYPEANKARINYRKAVKKAAATVRDEIHREVLGTPDSELSKNDLRVALHGDLSDDDKRAVLKVLNGKS